MATANNTTISNESKRILGYISTLAKSQGMYGRLLHALNEASDDDAENWLSQFHKCGDLLDFVIEFES